MLMVDGWWVVDLICMFIIELLLVSFCGLIFRWLSFFFRCSFSFVVFGLGWWLLIGCKMVLCESMVVVFIEVVMFMFISIGG